MICMVPIVLTIGTIQIMVPKYVKIYAKYAKYVKYCITKHINLL